MFRINSALICRISLQSTLTGLVLLCALAGQSRAEATFAAADILLTELESSSITSLEELVQKGGALKAKNGFASYYARRFEGRKTASGHRYHPEKMTGAHQSLPMGTVVRVVNPATSQEVHVTINDRCAKKTFPFIDLSRAAAKKIGLWGKGKIKVVIIPLLEENLEEPV
jgi:peptidoglycan lytic transglycosylase